MKIKYFYYIHIKYNILAKLKPSRKRKNKALAKFDTRENILFYSIFTEYSKIKMFMVQNQVPCHMKTDMSVNKQAQL